MTPNISAHYIDVIFISIASFGVTIATHVYSDTIAMPVLSNAMGVFLLAVPATLAVWSIGLFVCSRRHEAPEVSGISLIEGVGDYSDEPIQDDSQDLLGRTILVNRLYEQILRLPFPESFVFGLHAGWGEGKTSVLNLLYRRLNGDPAVIPVVFNPWYLATEAALIQSFYASIERELQSRYLIVGLHRTLSRYRDLLSSGLQSLGFGLELPIGDDPGRLRSEIESWVGRTGCRLVILIDDIDRLQATEVLSVFKLAALSARLQSTVFLLSFDQVVIGKMLKETADIDPAYLEKVIQKPLQLPPAEQQDIDRFLLFSDPEGSEGHRSAIDRLFDAIEVDANKQQEFKQRMESFYRIRLRGLFRTVRQAKRYVNSLRAALPPIVNEIDLYDFALLEIIQVFFPKVYQDIWRSPSFYVSAGTYTSTFTFPVGVARNEEEAYRNIREHIEVLLQDEPQADLVKAILEELFFEKVPKAFGRFLMTIRPQGMRTPREEKRLAHPHCFPKYFLYRMPKEEKLSDQSVEDLIHQWNKGAERVFKKLVVAPQAGLPSEAWNPETRIRPT